MSEENDDRILSAQEFLRLSGDADQGNRQEAIMDLEFVSGEQWPAELQNSRQLEARPCLTINKLDSLVRQVENNQRQQRPRIAPHPTGGRATVQTADVVKGLIRHIEVQSNADTAYDTAFSHACKMGLGYWRVLTDYAHEKAMHQEIFIVPEYNPFRHYRDPNSIEPDGRDAEKHIIADWIPRDVFNREFPDANDASSFTFGAAGDHVAEWVQKDSIRVAEYFWIERRKAKLIHLSDSSTMWEDELPSPELLQMAGLTIKGDRMSFKRSVQWAKLTAMDVLDQGEIPGKYIPIIPCYGRREWLHGKMKYWGMVRFGKDPQRMINYWDTAATESIALAPKAKWLLAEGQDEGHENEWNKANMSAMPVLRYKSRDIDGNEVPPPQRLQPEPPPQGILEALQVATGNLRDVLGVTDPAMRLSGNLSGKAINAERMQSDQATFDFYDNITRSISFTGTVLLGMIPHVYTERRVSRVIGDDGKPSLITLNDHAAESKVMNDMSVQDYDVVMETGPGYNTKRQEAVQAMTPLIQEPAVFQAIGDLFFRNSDFPGAETIADRLAAANPLAQIDEQSDVPPRAQMQIKQLTQQLQQAQQMLQQAAQAIKDKTHEKAVSEAAETHRETIRADAKLKDTTVWAHENLLQQQMGDRTKLTIARMDMDKGQHETELDGAIKILLKHLEGQHAERAAEHAKEQAKLAPQPKGN